MFCSADVTSQSTSQCMPITLFLRSSSRVAVEALRNLFLKLRFKIQGEKSVFTYPGNHLSGICRFKGMSNSSRMDNTTAVAYINHEVGIKKTDCDLISRDIWPFCQERDLWLYAVHLAGIENTEGDHESRRKDYVEWVLPQGIFDKLNRDFGPFDLDLFASRLTHKLPKYAIWLPDPFTEFIDAFCFTWDKFYFYAFPPFSLVLKVLLKAIQEKGSWIDTNTILEGPALVCPISQGNQRFQNSQDHTPKPLNGESWLLDLAAWVI